jgi:hypothetical protein
MCTQDILARGYRIVNIEDMLSRVFFYKNMTLLGLLGGVGNIIIRIFKKNVHAGHPNARLPDREHRGQGPERGPAARLSAAAHGGGGWLTGVLGSQSNSSGRFCGVLDPKP